MAKPQQPELHRNGLTPADPGSVKVRRQVSEKTPVDTPLAPVPESNKPGHHPPVEQDKPTRRFVEKARSIAQDAPPRSENFSPGAEAPAVGPQDGAEPPGARTSVAALVPAIAFVDALRQPQERWTEIGENRTLTLARIALLPFYGSWHYGRRVKSRLDGAEVGLRLRGG